MIRIYRRTRVPGRVGAVRLPLVLLAITSSLPSSVPAQSQNPTHPLRRGEVDSKQNFGSLFPADGTGWYTRRIAHQKGDLLTIVVNESSAANFTATTTATKTDSTSVNPFSSPILSWLKLGVLNAALGGASSGATSSVAGTGNTTNNRSLTAQIEVVVSEVTASGNLVVEGKKWIYVNKEAQNLTFSGVVRADDVADDNSVPSQNVANAEIHCDGKGMLADRQRRGVLTHLLEWLF